MPSCSRAIAPVSPGRAYRHLPSGWSPCERSRLTFGLGFCILKPMRVKVTAARFVLMVTVVGLIAGCTSAASRESQLPEWAHSLFNDVENLSIIESKETSVVVELRGSASDMAELIKGRLDEVYDFILHEQLAVTGRTDDGSVQVVWTPSNPDESSGLGNGLWRVEATLTED